MWGSAPAGTWEWLVGVDYNNDGGTNRTLKNFEKIANNRNDVYVIDRSIEGKASASNLKHPDREGAERELAQISQTFENEKLLKYCNLSIVGGPLFIPYCVEANYSPAYLMQMLANLATGEGPELGRSLTGKYAAAKTSFILSSGRIKKDKLDLTKIGGLTDPHLPITYYLIAHNNFKNRV